MPDWDRIVTEAERMAYQLRQRQVDLAEAEKAGDYYRSKHFDDAAMAHYLQALASNPPPRSRRSQGHYRAMHDLWTTWRTDLAGPDKARAWGWAVRVAKAGR